MAQQKRTDNRGTPEHSPGILRHGYSHLSHPAISSTGGFTVFTRIDHVMICVPDLQQGIDAYTRIGFNISRGGVHPGKGTHNAIAFYEEDYLELMSVRDRDEYLSSNPGGASSSFWHEAGDSATSPCRVTTSWPM
jgi:hypothetical protein